MKDEHKKRKGGKGTGEVEKLRTIHQPLCKAVDRVDHYDGYISTNRD